MTRRPIHGNEPTERIQAIVTGQQYASIAGLARGQGKSIAQWLRDAVMREMRAPDMERHLRFLIDAASIEPGMQIYIGHITAAKQMLDNLHV